MAGWCTRRVDGVVYSIRHSLEKSMIRRGARGRREIERVRDRYAYTRGIIIFFFSFSRHESIPNAREGVVTVNVLLATRHTFHWNRWLDRMLKKEETGNVIYREIVILRILFRAIKK